MAGFLFKFRWRTSEFYSEFTIETRSSERRWLSLSHVFGLILDLPFLACGLLVFRLHKMFLFYYINILYFLFMYFFFIFSSRVSPRFSRHLFTSLVRNHVWQTYIKRALVLSGDC